MRATFLTVGGAVTCAGSAALPWATTGEATRSGYQLVRAADAAGLADAPLARALVVAVALLPVLAAGAWIAGSLHRRGALATLGAAAGLVAGSSVAVVLKAPVGVEVGVYLAAAGVVATAVGLISLVRQERG